MRRRAESHKRERQGKKRLDRRRDDGAIDNDENLDKKKIKNTT